MKPLARRLALYGFLACCVVTAVVAEDKAVDTGTAQVSEAASGVAPRRAIPVSLQPEAAGARVHTEKMNRSFFAAAGADPFSVRSWEPAVQPSAASNEAAAPPVVAEAPTAPPLPFKIAGKLEVEPGKWLVYLTRGNETFSPSKGETFASVYRFDGIKNGNAVIVYLPLATEQLLPVGPDF